MEIAHTAEGAKALAEWLGLGGLPVDAELAAKRAGICVECPFNKQEPHGIKDTVADAIRGYQRVRRGLKLALLEDFDLKHCSVCDCPLQLKVWVPMPHIAPTVKHYPFPPHCWIYKEAIEHGVETHPEKEPEVAIAKSTIVHKMDPPKVAWVKGTIPQ